MKYPELISELIGKRIVGIIGYSSWDDERKWLSTMGSIVIMLEDGTRIDTLGEPLEINFSNENDKKTK
jgi:hypothetical protein